MNIVAQLGMCSEQKKEVGIQFKEESGVYTAAGSFLPGATSGASGVSSELNGKFLCAPAFKCKRCGKNGFLYQCSKCGTFVCYDGKEHKSTQCPKCGQTAGVAKAPQSRMIVVSGSGPAKPDILLVLDTSGSMKEEGRIDEVKKAALKNFIEKYDGKCRMGLVTFGAMAQVVLPLTDNMSKVKRALESCKPYGGTVSPFHCIRTDEALEEFRNSTNPRYLVVFTDGAWSGYEPNNVAAAVRLRRMGITIIAIGCAGAKREFLRDISSEGAAIETKDGSISGGFASAAKNIFGQG